MSYGTSFTVTTPNAAQIAKVSLIRSPSVTHALDMNQRFQFLNFTVNGEHAHRRGAGEREPRAARRLPALPRRHERRPVGRLVHPPEPGGAVGRHDAADRRRSPRRRAAPRSSGTVDVTANASRQRRRRRRPVQARRRRSRRRGRVGSLLDLLGHDHRRQRLAHADRGGARPRPATSATSATGARDGVEHGAAARPRRGLRLRRGIGHRPPRISRATGTTARSRTQPGPARPRASSGTRSRSTARMRP